VVGCLTLEEHFLGRDHPLAGRHSPHLVGYRP
jgi:hypothetical protein